MNIVGLFVMVVLILSTVAYPFVLATFIPSSDSLYGVALVAGAIAILFVLTITVRFFRNNTY